MSINKFILLSSCMLFLISCSTKYSTIGNKNIKNEKMISTSKRFVYKNHVYKNLNYAPTSDKEQWNYTRKIRVNVHFMDDSSGTRNIHEDKAVKYAKDLIRMASERLLKNEKMVLPENNNTPVLMPHYEYLLYPSPEEAVYVHQDNELYYYVDRGKYRNNYSKNVIKKYSIGDDSILNIFILPQHPDSIESKTYPNYSVGIAMGHNLKISGNFHSQEMPVWKFLRILNHEIGHILGLGHSWVRNDGCDDTPPHSNCYSNTGVPPCDKPASNNMMDYNGSEVALTPCQIGKIHKKIAKLNSRERDLVIEEWCQHDTSRVINIKEDVYWRSSLDLSHSVIIHPNSTLHISARVSFPKGSSLIVMPGGKLILEQARLHNDCGDLWNGIKIGKKGKKIGVVEYIDGVLIENIDEENNS